MGRKEKGVSTATTVKTPQKINGTSSTANCISSLPLTAEENNHFRGICVVEIFDLVDDVKSM